MQQAIEHRAHGGDIAEQLAPVFDGAVGSEQRAEAFVTAHDDFEQILGCGVWKFAHAEVVDDQQRDGGDRFDVFLARAICNSVGELVEQDVRFAIKNLVALQDGGLSDGLGEMALAGATRAELYVHGRGRIQGWHWIVSGPGGPSPIPHNRRVRRGRHPVVWPEIHLSRCSRIRRRRDRRRAGVGRV
jgi:hypothetical protein